jgi:hypothetical protein
VPEVANEVQKAAAAGLLVPKLLEVAFDRLAFLALDPRLRFDTHVHRRQLLRLKQWHVSLNHTFGG